MQKQIAKKIIIIFTNLTMINGLENAILFSDITYYSNKNYNSTRIYQIKSHLIRIFIVPLNFYKNHLLSQTTRVKLVN